MFVAEFNTGVFSHANTGDIKEFITRSFAERGIGAVVFVNKTFNRAALFDPKDPKGMQCIEVSEDNTPYFNPLNIYGAALRSYGPDLAYETYKQAVQSLLEYLVLTNSSYCGCIDILTGWGWQKLPPNDKLDNIFIVVINGTEDTVSQRVSAGQVFDTWDRLSAASSSRDSK